MEREKYKDATGRKLMIMVLIILSTGVFAYLLWRVLAEFVDAVWLLAGVFGLAAIAGVTLARALRRTDPRDESTSFANPEDPIGDHIDFQRGRTWKPAMLLAVGLPVIVMIVVISHHLVTNNREPTPLPPNPVEQILQELEEASAPDSTKSMEPELDEDGLTELHRRRIYTAAVLADDRAYNESWKQYPYVPTESLVFNQEQARKQMDLNTQLALKYRKKVAAEYGISTEKLVRIIFEGNREEWPLPPLKLE